MQQGTVLKSVWFWVASAAVVAAVAVGVDYYHWRNAMLEKQSAAPSALPSATTTSTAPKPVLPAVSKPKTTSVPPPAPIVQPAPTPAPEPVPAVVVNHSGTWKGTFVSTAPSQCSGFTGTLTMQMTDAAGSLSGDFSASDGTSGPLKGSVADTKLTVTVLSGDSVILTLSGDMTDSHMSGTFNRKQECASGSGPVAGTFTGDKK